ncbi:MAG: hypothetical protein V2A73_03995 [Pseudomonadota bacterium]
MAFLKAQLAYRRGNVVAARTLMSSCLQEIEAPMPPRSSAAMKNG